MHATNQFNGSTGNHNSSPPTENEPKGLGPTWSVRETRRQFEQMGAGPPMSNSFSGDLRPYRGRYKEQVEESRRKHNDDIDESFNAIKLNEGGPQPGRRRSNDEHNINRFHPHGPQAVSYNLQRFAQQQNPSDNFTDSHTVAQYYPTNAKPANQNPGISYSTSFQAPRLVSQTHTITASSRPNQSASSSSSVQRMVGGQGFVDRNREGSAGKRINTAPPYTANNGSRSTKKIDDSDWHHVDGRDFMDLDYQNLNKKSANLPEIRTIVAVPETDILEDSMNSDDDLMEECGTENHERDGSINYERGLVMNDSSSDEEDDIAVRAQLEREEIVERYDKGADDEENIRHAENAWENPDFELYQKTDRYGFIHKESIRSNQEKKDRERERRRCLKWDRMFRDWEFRTPAKLSERIWKGVPDSYRLKIWRKMLSIDDLIEKHGAEKYEELLIRGKLLSTEVRQIDVDVARTYRDHIMFMKRYDASQQSVFNVLVAYSMFNTEVGYCQGMNNLAAILLMYLGDEASAFWGLHSLITNRKYSMHGFFVPGFPKLHRFEAHFEKVMQKYLPKLHRHMEQEGIPRPYHAKWWFGVYVDRLPFSLAMRVWDVFILIGDSILISMAFNILKIHQRDLSKASLEVFMDIIQNRISVDFGMSDDKALESLRKCWERLQDDKMALPPQPKNGETPELPVKALGPILRRSLVDIRMDIAELHSRSSRTNSRIDLTFQTERTDSEMPFIDEDDELKSQ